MTHQEFSRQARRCDVVVVGAGSAGAACALFCARAGLQVICVDRQNLEQAGARWVNGVPGWCFDEAGLARPKFPEDRSEGHRFHMFAGWGPTRLVLDDLDMYDVDMRLLVERLHRVAREAGVEFLSHTSVLSRAGKTVKTTRGPIEADVIVDASGLTGAKLSHKPRVAPEDLCSAAQEVREINDIDTARAYFGSRDVRPGDTLCYSGVCGGYSILNLRLEHNELSILTGSIPALGHDSGRAMINRFVRQRPWIGPVVFGGGRAIPIRHPMERLVDGPVALLGDSACQVFAAHGSGVGAGLVAARMLAETVIDRRALADYNFRWQRTYGGLFVASYLFARYSRELGPADIAAMLESGIMSDPSVRSTMLQQLPQLGPTDVLAFATGAVKIPRQVGRFLPLMGRVAACQLHYRFYPEDPRRLDAWTATLHRLMGG